MPPRDRLHLQAVSLMSCLSALKLTPVMVMVRAVRLVSMVSISSLLLHLSSPTAAVNVPKPSMVTTHQNLNYCIIACLEMVICSH